MSLRSASHRIFSELLYLFSIFANYTFLGPIKMTAEAFRGVTISGEVLTVFGRINHLIIQSTNVMAYILFFRGSIQAAGWLYAFSWLVDSIQYYPEILGSLGRLCGSIGMRRTSQAIAKTKTWLDIRGIRKQFFK